MKLDSKKRIEVRGKEIELIADSKFRFETAGLVIELTPSTITIAGDTTLASEDTIVIKGTENLTV
jgi:hypothetical protein